MRQIPLQNQLFYFIYQVFFNKKNISITSTISQDSILILQKANQHKQYNHYRTNQKKSMMQFFAK
jgi:hypothetical protein